MHPSGDLVGTHDPCPPTLRSRRTRRANCAVPDSMVVERTGATGRSIWTYRRLPAGNEVCNDLANPGTYRQANCAVPGSDDDIVSARQRSDGRGTRALPDRTEPGPHMTNWFISDARDQVMREGPEETEALRRE